MRPEAIFRPMGVLALWTGLVLLLNGVRRIRAVRGGRVTPDDFRLGDGAAIPVDLSIPNRNLMNLLEMPVLFYVVILALYVTRQVEPLLLGLSWLYVALRLVHSLIHLTTNRVVHRLAFFAVSNFVLLALWILFLARL